MSGIIDSIKKVTEHEMKKILTTELGIVTSVFTHAEGGDINNYECNVKLKDKDLELRKVPLLTQHIGLSHPPQIGEMVLVTFVNGDINSPVVLGRLYNDEDRPPLGKLEEVIYRPPYSKNPGLKRLNLVFPGSEDNVNIEIHDDSMTAKIGNSMIMVKESGLVEIRTEPGKNSILVIDDRGLRVDTDADVQIHSKGSLTIECDQDLILKAQNINIESQQGIKIKSGSSLDIHSAAALAIKSGAPLSIKSDALGSVEATGPLTVKSSAILTVQGTLVKIN